MMAPFLFGLLVASPGARAQEDTGALEEVELTEEEEGLEGYAEEPEVAQAPKRRAKRKKARRSEATPADTNRRLLLGVVALLLLWLLARSPSARGEEAPRRRRRTPLSHEELGRAVFQVARAADFQGYRDLFINGPEAGRLLGVERAKAYLRQRSDDVLEDALAELAALLPPGAVYHAVKPVQGGMLGLETKGPTGTLAVIPVGTVTEVGGAQRLVYPPLSSDDVERFRTTNHGATA